jgi:hypothetical protein
MLAMTDDAKARYRRILDKSFKETLAVYVKGDIDGLYGRMPADAQKLVRKIADAPNYDYAAMEFLDALGTEWRA